LLWLFHSSIQAGAKIVTQNSESNPERRQYERQEGGAEVVVAIPGRPPLSLRTSNYSKQGIFLLYGAKDKPAEGTEITVTLKEFLSDDIPMAMKAKIVYVEETGFGIEITGPLD
jgi:hypothetical protein